MSDGPPKRDGWHSQPPIWQGCRLELDCPSCGFRYWIYDTLKVGAPRPNILDPWTRRGVEMRRREVAP